MAERGRYRERAHRSLSPCPSRVRMHESLVHLQLPLTCKGHIQGAVAARETPPEPNDMQEREQEHEDDRHKQSGRTVSRLSPPRLHHSLPRVPSPEQIRWLEAQGHRHHVNALAREEQRQKNPASSTPGQRPSKVPDIGTFLDGSAAMLGTAETLDARNGEKVAHFSKKRLVKSKHCIISGAGSCAALDVSAALRHPKGTIDVAHLSHHEIEVGNLIGAGSFSYVFGIKSLRVSTPAPPDDQLLFSQFDHDAIMETRRHDMQSSCKDTEPCPFVLKVLQPKLLQDPAQMASCAADLAKEGLLMASLRHDHILKARAWTPTGLRGYATGRNDAFFLVLDRLDRGTLSDQIKSWQKQGAKPSRHPLKILQPKQQRHTPSDEHVLHSQLDIILQLSDALQYLHAQRIIHRDIKPDNVGLMSAETSENSQPQSPLAEELSVKLFDFDVARNLPPATSALTINHVDGMFMLTRHVGSPRYMSPECARGDAYNASCDVYSFGLVAHQVLSLQQPYADIDTNDFTKLVVEEEIRPSVPSSWPFVWHELLPSCWSGRPELRPSMYRVYELLKANIPKLQRQLVSEEQPKESKVSSSHSYSSDSSGLKKPPRRAKSTSKTDRVGPSHSSLSSVVIKCAQGRQGVLCDSSSSTQSNSIGDVNSLDSDDVDDIHDRPRRRRRRKPWTAALRR